MQPSGKAVNKGSDGVERHRQQRRPHEKLDALRAALEATRVDMQIEWVLCRHGCHRNLRRLRLPQFRVVQRTELEAAADSAAHGANLQR